MRKRILCLIAVLICTLSVVACSKGKTHQHTYSDKWSYNETYHWREPTCHDTKEPKGKSIHNFYKGECTLCHYPDPNYVPPEGEEDPTDPSDPSVDPNEGGEEDPSVDPNEGDKDTEEEQKPTVKPSINNEGKTFTRDGYEITEIYGGDGEVEGYSVAAGEHKGDSTITIPVVFMGLPVLKIARMGFQDCTATSITIPSTVREMGYMAFSGCKNVRAFDLPDALTEIGAMCFMNCSSITKITIPDGVQTLRYKTFFGCSSLDEVVLSDSVEVLSPKVFEDCTGLHTITLGKGIKEIMNRAFYKCKALSTIRVADLSAYCSMKVYELAETHPAQFAKHIFDISTGKNITNLVIPGDVKNVSAWAFYQMNDIVSVTISSGVKSCGDWCFAECKSLKTVKIDSGLSEIGAGAFSDCDALTNVFLPPSLGRLAFRLFMNCDNLKTVSIGRGVTSIEDEIFANCISLETVTYRGTKEQWDSIAKRANWNYMMINVSISFDP